MPEDDLVQAHVYISGRVQGVSFRFYTRQQANQLGVNGWVRNVRDGRVEAVFQGNRLQVDRILKWCERGPTSAIVEDVVVAWQKPSEIFPSFKITY